MRRIRVTQTQFIGPAIAFVASDAADLASQTSFEANDLGCMALKTDDGSLWFLGDVDTPTWTQLPVGFATAPEDVAAAAAAGTAITALRGDAVHDHGTQTAGTLHAAASATVAGFMSTASYKKTVGIGMSNFVTVPAGSGTKLITTTEALLTAANQTSCLAMDITFWKSLDQAETKRGSLEFSVTWNDDDTQTISQTDAANADSGATPTITIAVHSVNVVLLLNADHTVSVSLTRDGTHARGCKVRYFVKETVGQEIVPATFQSATTNAAGSSIAVTYDVALDEASVPAAEAFTLHGTTATVASVGISSNVLTLTLTGNVAYSETVTWDYAVPESNPILADGDGGPAAALSAAACTNAVPPAFVSAICNAAGDEITATWAGALDEASTPDGGDFALAGTSATIDSVTVTGSTVVLGLTTANIAYGESPTLSYTQGVTPLRSAAAVNVANLTTESVTNAVPPAFSSATSNNAGSQIVATWAGNLNESSVPEPGAFTLAGTSATVLSVGVSGADVTLTLETALVEYGETVTVSYTQGSTPLQSAEGFDIANITTESVTNVTPPDFVSATTDADGNAIVATFEGNLDAGSEPAIGAFALSGTSAALDSVTSISGTDLTLALDSSVLFEETLLFSYTKPGSNPLRENTTEYECVSFADQSVTNITPPVLSSLVTNALGTEITATYSAALDEASVPATTDFSIAGDDATVNGVYVEGSTVRLTLDGAIEYGDSATLSYTPGTNKIRSDVGNLNVAALSTEAITCAVPPALSTADTDAVDGSEIILVWAGNLNESSVPAATCFNINGDDATVASVDVTGATVTLTLSGNIENGDTITIDYVVPESNPLQSAAGYNVAPLVAAAVTNNVPA